MQKNNINRALWLALLVLTVWLWHTQRTVNQMQTILSHVGSRLQQTTRETQTLWIVDSKPLPNLRVISSKPLPKVGAKKQ